MGLDLVQPFRFLERILTNWLSGNPFPDWRTELFFSDDQGARMPSHTTDITEFGLLLPNGQVLWNAYSNHPLNTPADRAMMVQVLCKTAEECGFPEAMFLENYKWVSRRVKTEVTDLGTYSLTDPVVVTVDNQVHNEDYGTHDNNDIAEASGAVGGNGHGGDLREGSLGGVAPGTA